MISRSLYKGLKVVIYFAARDAVKGAQSVVYIKKVSCLQETFFVVPESRLELPSAAAHMNPMLTGYRFNKIAAYPGL